VHIVYVASTYWAAVHVVAWFSNVSKNGPTAGTVIPAELVATPISRGSVLHTNRTSELH
jgi:hypothetical protein